MKQFVFLALSAILINTQTFSMETNDELDFPKDHQITAQTLQKEINQQAGQLIDKFYKHLNQTKKFGPFSTKATDFWKTDDSKRQADKTVSRGFKNPSVPLSEALKALWNDKDLVWECSASKTFVTLSILQTLLGEGVMNAWALDLEKNKKLILLQTNDLTPSYFEGGSEKYFLSPLISFLHDFFSTKDGPISKAPAGSFGCIFNFPSILMMDPYTSWGFENVASLGNGQLWGFGPAIWGECKPVSYEEVREKHIGEYKRVREEFKKKSPDKNSKLNKFEDGSFVSKIVMNNPQYLKGAEVPYAPNPDSKVLKEFFEVLQMAYGSQHIELDPKKLWGIVEKYSPKKENQVEKEEGK